jgi:hypothetical protein
VAANCVTSAGALMMDCTTLRAEAAVLVDWSSSCATDATPPMMLRGSIFDQDGWIISELNFPTRGSLSMKPDDSWLYVGKEILRLCKTN